MTMFDSISRRSMLAGAAKVVGAGSLLFVSTPSRVFGQDVKPITVGFIYAATRNDYGWNQAHAVAARRIAALPGIKLVEQERVPETVQVERVMESIDRKSTRLNSSHLGISYAVFCLKK